MASLYACLFSNGHIKVGRSASASDRIKQHKERVACMGVSLTESYITDCPDNDEGREQILITRCAQAASARFQHEWFAGLSFTEVCHWAYQAAHSDVAARLPALDASQPDFQSILRGLRQAGYGQVFLAQRAGISQSYLSDLSTGKTTDPSYSVGAALIRIAGELLPD